MAHVGRADLNLLVVLEAIASEGGVTRAGERLNLTQSAVSHALARLRDVFGDPLFVREGHTLRPTPLTRGIIEPLRQNLQSLGKLFSEADGFDPAKSTARFTISLRDPLEALVLPPLMSAVTKAAPSIDLRTTQARRRNGTGRWSVARWATPGAGSRPPATASTSSRTIARVPLSMIGCRYRNSEL